MITKSTYACPEQLDRIFHETCIVIDGYLSCVDPFGVQRFDSDLN